MPRSPISLRAFCNSVAGWFRADLQLEDRPGGGKFWATYRPRSNFLEGQKPNPRRSDDSLTSVRVYRNACYGYKGGDGKLLNNVARLCNPVQLLAGGMTPLSQLLGRKVTPQSKIAGTGVLRLAYRLLDQWFGCLNPPSRCRFGARPGCGDRDNSTHCMGLTALICKSP